MGRAENISMVFSPEDNCYFLELSQSFKNIKVACNICSEPLKNKDGIYFCKQQRIFMCKYCAIYKHKFLWEQRDYHEDNKVIPLIEERLEANGK